MRVERGAVGLAILLGLSIPGRAVAQVPDKFTNLQVLPKDIARGELVATMRGFAGALGVRCTHCHVGPDNLQGMDFAADDKDTKKAARVMLQMVRAINADYLSKVPDASARRQVTCLTCHRSAEKPPRPLEDIVNDAVVKQGVAAGLAEFEKYRSDYLGSGLYDFRERTLNVVGTRLREAKRLDDAVGIFKASLEKFPQSPVALSSLAQLALEQGNPADAEMYAKRLVDADPNNGFAKQLLEKARAAAAAKSAPPK